MVNVIVKLLRYLARRLPLVMAAIAVVHPTLFQWNPSIFGGIRKRLVSMFRKKIPRDRNDASEAQFGVMRKRLVSMFPEKIPRGRNYACLARFMLDFEGKFFKETYVDHDSINYLDISNCEYSCLIRSNFSDPCRVIFTKEGWKKRNPERRLLYTLHLDIGIRREKQLKLKFLCAKQFRYGRRFLCSDENEDITAHMTKYALASFALEATEKSTKKLYLLAKLLKLMKSASIQFFSFKRREVEYFLRILMNECKDSSVVKDFLSLVNFKMGIVLVREEEILEYIMYHAQRSGYLSSFLRSNDLDDIIISAFRFLNFIGVEILLKFIDTPKFYENNYTQFKETFPPTLNTARYRSLLDLPYSRRNFLVLQIIWTYVHVRINGLRAAEDPLRLIWRSIPDTAVTSEEFGSALGSDDFTKVERFYHGVIGETPPGPGPRSLQHLCRTTIRSTLSKNSQLPDGISQVGLPKILQAYVGLEL